MNTPNVAFNVTNLTQQVPQAISGLSYIIGDFIRGPINDPSNITNNWPQFVRMFGGLKNNNLNQELKRYFDKGGKARICRVSGYTDIDSPGSLPLAASASNESVIENEDNVQIFRLRAKNPGANYNNIKIVISNASNGLPNSFNLYINHSLEPGLNETYTNLSVTLPNSINEPITFLNQVSQGSQLVNVEYGEDLMDHDEEDLRPKNIVTSLIGGTDGPTLTDADYIGSSSTKSGLHSFSNFEDSYYIFFMKEVKSNALHTAASAYTDSRKDLFYLLDISYNYTTADSIVTQRNALNIDSKFTFLLGGGLRFTNNINNQEVKCGGLADIAALATKSDTDFGPWFSFSGNQRGIITNALGPVVNFGGPMLGDKNLLANNQINLIINEDGSNKLWHGFTAQRKQDQESFLSVAKGVIFIKRSLKPLLKDYLEQPNDMSSWKLMYFQCKTFLDSLVTRRALFGYRWEGDQDANNLDQLIINKKSDVSMGKYKVRLSLSFIPGMQEIEVDLYLTPGDLSIVDSL
jgi:hypothetical protein